MKRIIFLLIATLALMECHDEDWFIPSPTQQSTPTEENTPTPEWKTYLEGYEIKDIADAGNYLWLTDGKEVIKFNKNTGCSSEYGFDGIEMPPDYQITSIACTENGLPWVSAPSWSPTSWARKTSIVLKMNENEKWIILPPVRESQSDIVGDIFITDNDVVWTNWTKMTVPWLVGRKDNILVRYQGNTVDTFKVDDRISSLAEDKDGNLWIGEWYSEEYPENNVCLVRYDGENWTTFNSPYKFGPWPGAVSEITFDELGNIWMAGHFGIMDSRVDKLLKFDNSKWQSYGLPTEALTAIKSLAIQDNGTILLGTTKGLMKFSNSQWTVFDTENSELPSNGVNSIVIDDNATIWIGTGNGLVALSDADLEQK